MIEGLGKVHRNFTARSVPHDRQGVRERIDEVTAQQAGALGDLLAQGVAQPVVFSKRRVLGQQIPRRWSQIETVERILVGFDPDVLEESGITSATDRFAGSPIPRVGDLLYPWQKNRIEIVGHLDQNKLATGTIVAIQVDDRVAGRAGSREEIEDDPIFRRNEADKFGQQISRFRILEHLTRTERRFQCVRSDSAVMLDKALQITGIVLQVLLDLNDLILVVAEKNLVAVEQPSHGLLGKSVAPCRLYTRLSGDRMNDVVAIAFLPWIVDLSPARIRTVLVDPIVVRQGRQHLSVVSHEFSEVRLNRFEACA